MLALNLTVVINELESVLNVIKLSIFVFIDIFTVTAV